MSFNPNAITYSEMQLLTRLAQAYPDHVPPDRLVERMMNLDGHGELGDLSPGSSTQVCNIRRKLGADSIETVFARRINKKGQVVRVGTCLGYRLSDRLALDLMPDVLTGASEGHTEESGVLDTTPQAPTSLRRSGRSQEKIAMQMAQGPRPEDM